MACAAQVFSGVNADQFCALQAKANGQGLAITGNQGSVSHSGVTVEYSYDSTAETLTLTCTGKPFIASCGMVNSRLHDLVESVLDSK